VRLTTAIARERIDDYLIGKIQHVPLALETLELYGDKSDIDRMIGVLNKTDELTEFYNASLCLFLLDSEYAETSLRLRANDLGIDKFALDAMYFEFMAVQLMYRNCSTNILILSQCLTKKRAAVMKLLNC
jgi:hypothetical protein